MPENFALPTLQELQEWVAEQPKGAIVGFCRSSGGCMLAQYLQEKYPDFKFGISYGAKEGFVCALCWKRGTSADDNSESSYLPAPALVSAILRFDNLASWDDPITREQALTCFDEVDRGGV